MFRLVWRLLPYAMVLGGTVLALAAVPTIVTGGEPAPTAVALADVSAAAPKARWLKVTGGGLFLPDAVIDEQVKKSTGARKVKAYYVPLVSEADADVRMLAMAVGPATEPAATRPAAGAATAAKSAAATATTRPAGPASLVLVRFSPDEFLRLYPTPDRVTPDDMYRPTEVTGTRASNVLFPERLKDFVRSELSMPLENVVVVNYGDEPLQRGQAIVLAAVLSGVALLGLVWVIARWRRPAPSPQPMPPQMQVPPGYGYVPPMPPAAPPPVPGRRA